MIHDASPPQVLPAPQTLRSNVNSMRTTFARQAGALVRSLASSRLSRPGIPADCELFLRISPPAGSPSPSAIGDRPSDSRRLATLELSGKSALARVIHGALAILDARRLPCPAATVLPKAPILPCKPSAPVARDRRAGTAMRSDGRKCAAGHLGAVVSSAFRRTTNRLSVTP